MIDPQRSLHEDKVAGAVPALRRGRGIAESRTARLMAMSAEFQQQSMRFAEYMKAEKAYFDARTETARSKTRRSLHSMPMWAR